MVGPIAICIDGMSGPGSGAWSRISCIVKGLVSYGVEVHILGNSGSHEQASSWGAASLELIPKASRLKRLVRRKRQLSGFLDRTGSKIVQLEAPPYAGQKNVPTIASLHDLRGHSRDLKADLSLSTLYKKFLMPIDAASIQGWLALSSNAAGEITETLGIARDKVFLIPPIVEIPPQNPSGLKVHDVTYVLALGHLEARKNLETVVLASLESAWPEGVELWIAGEDHGSLLGLQTVAGGTNHKVRFLGAVGDREKWALLSGALLVVVPSLIEGFGLVAVEAPLSGTPSLVSDRSSLSELSAHPLAAVPAKNPALWAQRVAKLYASPNDRSKILRAQRKQAQLFTTDAIIPLLIGVYQQIESS